MPRKAPVKKLSPLQIYSLVCGWAGMALVLASLLYWLYLNSLLKERDWIVVSGLVAGGMLLTMYLVGMGALIVSAFRSPEGKRAMRSTIFIAAIIAILCVGNALAYRRHAQWDVTGNRRLSLSPLTIKLLQTLPATINVTAFYTQSPQRRYESMEEREVADLLAQYADRSTKFHYKVVDYLAQPDKFVSANVTSNPPVVLFTNESGGREEVKGTTEQDFTGALLKLTQTNNHKIYFTSGHGELSPDGQDQNGATVVKQVMTDEQTGVESLDLMGKERSVPADCTVLVIAGPRVDFQPDEIKAVKTYLGNGGSALVLLRAGGPDLSWLLKDYGVTADSDVIAQLLDLGGMTAISQQLRIASFPTHDIDRGLTDIVFPDARSLSAISPPPAGVNTTSLVQTSDDTIGKPLKLGQQKVDLMPKPTDPKGPFTLAMLSDREEGAKKSHIVVVGSTEWAMDLLASSPSASNRYLFTNSANWLADDNILVNIPPKEDAPDTLDVTPDAKVRMLYLNFLLAPAVSVFMALFLWWRRR